MELKYKDDKIRFSNIAWEGYRQRVYIALCHDLSHDDPGWLRQNFDESRRIGEHDFTMDIPPEFRGKPAHVFAVYADKNDDTLLQDSYYAGKVFCGSYSIEVKRKPLMLFAGERARVEIEVRASEKLMPGDLVYRVLGREYPVPVEIPAKTFVKLPGVDLPGDAVRAMEFRLRDGIPKENYRITDL